MIDTLVSDLGTQVRVLESLYDYAGWLGDVTPRGVRVSRTCMLEMVLDLGIAEKQVNEMLVRLRRLGLAIPADSGAVVLTDVPRLMDFARFIAARSGGPPPSRASGVALVMAPEGTTDGANAVRPATRIA